ncbi:MAG: hypothetical protein M3Y87_13915, partial [Myxococcota bacterium]|nr:hypothetical protein [Myxococcota bacterium]
SAPPPTSIAEGIIPPLPWDLAPVTGTDHVVSSLADFLAALEIAEPGDAVSIEGGTYDGWGQLELPATVSGTAEAPIVIRSRTAPVVFTGETRFRIRGSHLHMYGLSFHGVTAGALQVDGRADAPSAGVRFSMIHCREAAGQCLYIEDAVGVRFDHSLVERSQSKGVHVGNQSMHTRIDHNVFRDRPVPVDANGFEQIQLGHATFTSTDEGVDSVRVRRTDALIDHNVFARCVGEGEMIGIKTSGNVIAFNVIVDAQERGLLSFRSGPNNLAFGNVFRQTRGAIRFLSIANRAVSNLAVDPIQYPGIDLPYGSDRAYMPTDTDYYTVEYIAARQGLIRNNTFAFTERSVEQIDAAAMREDRQSDGECRAGRPADDFDCDVVPFDNTISRNLVINDGDGATVGFSAELVASNRSSDNVSAISAPATLASSDERAAILGPLFPEATADLAAAQRALAELVWDPQPGMCLRIDAPDRLDEQQGAAFSVGECELACEDPGAAWREMSLFVGEGIEGYITDAALIALIASMPPSAVPTIPAWTPPAP